MMAAPFPKIPDCARFRQLWEQSVPAIKIAKEFDVSFQTVNRLAKGYGYPPRYGRDSKLSGPMPDQPPIDQRKRLSADPVKDQVKDPVAAPEEKPKPALNRPDDRWSPDRDQALVDANGRYRDMAALADQWGLTYRALLTRWHKLRAL